MAMRETFIIGDKEYAASKIAAFEANGIILKLQKLILPVLGGMAGGGNIMDMDVNEAFKTISEKLDESVMADIVMPMFKLAQVASVTDNIKIDSPQAINKVFNDADGLADLYTLIFDVLKFNFSGFFSKMGALIGGKSGTPKAMELTTTE